MKQDHDQTHETKSRIPVWLYPSTLGTLDAMLSRDNCKSRSEFIERAVQFYAGYISGQEATAYLPSALVSAMRGTIQSTEDRIARLLFKLAVEVDMMMNVMALALDINKEELDRLRADCVMNVKKTRGAISFKDAVELQQDER